MKRDAIRQGDVVVIFGVEIPEGCKPSGMVAAEGEVTGHRHRIDGGGMVLTAPNNAKFMRIDSPQTEFIHDEHGPHVLRQGEYAIKIQREYEPEGWRNVID